MRIKKLFYLSPRDLRKNRADPVHIMLSCQAFSKREINVELIAPIIHREGFYSGKNLLELYGVEDGQFQILEYSTKIHEDGKGQTGYLFNIFQILKAISLLIIKNFKAFRKVENIIYSKCYISIMPFLFLKKIGIIKSLIVFEAIAPKKSWVHKITYKHADKIISHLKFVTEEILIMAPNNPSKIYEPPFFTQAEEVLKIKASKQELRSELSLDKKEYYVLYAGKTGEDTKQVDYFIEAAKRIPHLKFLIVGANDNTIEKYQDIIKKYQISNLEVFPFQPLIQYYKFVLASNLLIGYYPYTKHNAYNLSPGKSGIYFATKNACIFSDLPSLRSIFPDDSVFYVEPDQPELLAEKIQYVYKNPCEAITKANNAYNFALNSTYDNLGLNILNFIENDRQ